MRAILTYNGWKICFFILGIQYFHRGLGSAAGTDWLLGEASIVPKGPDNAMVELQIGNAPHGQEDLVYFYGFLFEVQNYA